MNLDEVSKLLMAISAAYPYYAKRQSELGRDGQQVTANVWELAMVGVKYADASKALALHIKQSKYAPSPAEIIELAREIIRTAAMDEMAAFDAKYNRMFADWTRDGLSRPQRIQRMSQARLCGRQDMEAIE